MKRRAKIVTAFTHANDDLWLPAQFVVGELVVRRVRSDHHQYFVDGSMVDGATITPIPDPTPDMVRVLKEKSAAWASHDRLLARRRGRKDDTFREKAVDEEAEVHLVRADQSEAFGTFCREMSSENQRLTAERQAEVADLVSKHRRKAR
jgi:hypothetical protein